MEGSRYPNKVEVRAEDLQRTESTKADAIKTRTVDFIGSAQGGIISGLRVTVGAFVNTAVDISVGTAYAPNGERIDMDVAQTSVALSDPTLDVVNIVCVVYEETATTPRAAETGGTTQNTATEAGFRIVVLTEAEYDALPASFDSDMSVNAQDRIVKLAEVTGNGLAVALTSGDITQEDLTTFDFISAYYDAAVIPGVNIVGHGALQPVVSPTVDGASLQLRITTTGTKFLSYRQEGRAAYGTESADISSTIGDVTVSSDIGSTITCNVHRWLMPRKEVVDRTLAAPITVEPVYDQVGGVFSPADRAHRAKQGRGTPSAGNPHGTGFEDIAQGFATILSSIILGEGAQSNHRAGGTPQILSKLCNAASYATGHRLIWEGYIDNSTVGRVRLVSDVNTNMLSLTLNAKPTPGTNTQAFMADSWGIGQTAYRMELHRDGGAAIKMLVADTLAETIPSGDWRELFAFWPEDFTATNRGILALGLGFNGQNADDNERPRVAVPTATTSVSTNKRTLLFDSKEVFGGATNVSNFRVYRSNVVTGTSGQGVSGSASLALELTVNAYWDGDNTDAAGRWLADNGAGNAYKLEFTNSGLALWHTETASPWVDQVSASDWHLSWAVDASTGRVVMGAHLTVTDYVQTPYIDDLTPRPSSFGYDRIYRGMVPVVAGVIERPSAVSLFVNTPAPTLLKGYNVNSVAYSTLASTGLTGINITFPAMPDDNYVVILKGWVEDGTLAQFQDAILPKVVGKGATNVLFGLNYFDVGSNTIADANLDGPGTLNTATLRFEFLILANG